MIATLILLTQLQFISVQSHVPFIIDSTNSCIFPLSKANEWRVSGVPVKSANLSAEELELISSLLQSSMTLYREEFYDRKSPDYNEMINFNFDSYINSILSKYSYQLVPFIDVYGNKQVWINCVYNGSYQDWLYNGIPWINDGGDLYFNFMIDLSKSSFYNFRINGGA